MSPSDQFCLLDHLVLIKEAVEVSQTWMEERKEERKEG